MEIGLLIIRIMIGCVLMAHGVQKLFGWFGGLGLPETGRHFDAVGFRPGMEFAVVAGLVQVGGGLTFALGFLTPFASALIIAVMLVAALECFKNGFFVQQGGCEYPLCIAAVATGVTFAGPGALSLDHAAGLALAGTKWGLIALGLGLIGTVPAVLAWAASNHQRKADATDRTPA
jgi:putative oxidoreductase